MTTKKMANTLRKAGFTAAEMAEALIGLEAKRKEARKAEKAKSARPGSAEEVRKLESVRAFVKGGGKLSAPVYTFGFKWYDENGKLTDSAWTRIAAEWETLPDVAK